MGAAMAAITAAETGDRNADAAALAEPFHKRAFRTIDERPHGHDLAGSGQLIHVPVTHLRWPRMAAKAGANAAWPPQ